MSIRLSARILRGYSIPGVFVKEVQTNPKLLCERGHPAGTSQALPPSQPQAQKEYFSDSWNCLGLNITRGAPKLGFGNGGPAAGQEPIKDKGFV